MHSALLADDYRRLLEVVVAAGRAESLEDLLETTVAAVDEHLGYECSAFMLTLGTPGVPGTRAYAGMFHGIPEFVPEEYFERWANCDSHTSEVSRAHYRRFGWSSVAAVYPDLAREHRRYVDEFLRRVHQPAQLGVWLDPGTATHGYLTLSGEREFSGRDLGLALALRPHLTNLLRAHVPRGLGGSLSTRQAEVAELVAMGRSNREIAEVLGVGEDTVKKHVSNALASLGLERRTQLAVAWATGERGQAQASAS